MRCYVRDGAYLAFTTGHDETSRPPRQDAFFPGAAGGLIKRSDFGHGVFRGRVGGS